MANIEQYYEIIQKPLLTEKSSNLQESRNQYSFRVHSKANKSEVRKAVEVIFDVKVKRVNVINMPSKLRRFLGRPGRSSPWKKALLRSPKVMELYTQTFASTKKGDITTDTLYRNYEVIYGWEVLERKHHPFMNEEPSPSRWRVTPTTWCPLSSADSASRRSPRGGAPFTPGRRSSTGTGG